MRRWLLAKRGGEGRGKGEGRGRGERESGSIPFRGG